MGYLFLHNRWNGDLEVWEGRNAMKTKKFLLETFIFPFVTSNFEVFILSFFSPQYFFDIHVNPTLLYNYLLLYNILNINIDYGYII